MRRALLAVTLAAVGGGVASRGEAFDLSHAAFDAVLREHVVEGRVDYRRLAEHPRPLHLYAQSLAAISSHELAAWPRNDQLAFWINAYNAFTLLTILEHYPLSRGSVVGLAFPANSIWQIPNVWRDARWRAAGQAVSLDRIEKEIVRPQFHEPRAHFALVCASSSCPDLRSEAYRGDRLDAQLEDQTRRFLADPMKGARLEPARGRIRVSKIFRWYAEDFGASGEVSGPSTAATPQSGVLAFIGRHSTDEAVKAFVRGSRVGLAYLDYDWTLNEQRSR
jgi:Protein of unknown function, DUF547